MRHQRTVTVKQSTNNTCHVLSFQVNNLCLTRNLPIGSSYHVLGLYEFNFLYKHFHKII